MSLPSPYIESYQVADGVTTSFAFGSGFSAPAAANVKCIIYFSDGTNCVPTFTVDTTTGYITIVTLTKPDGTVLTVPPAGSIVRIFRDTPEQQNVTASQLQNYTAKQLERIFDSVVAMIQEVQYLADHKTIRLTETQRDVAVEQLTESKDQSVLYWDFDSRTIKATDYGQDEIVKSDTVDRLVYIQGEGKIYFIPKGSVTPISIGSVTIHNDLSGRNAPDCHPESAITNLTTHLQELRDADTAIDDKADQALSKAGEALTTANNADANATYAVNIATTFDGRLTQAESDASDAKDAATNAVNTVNGHLTDYNNPHSVTASQVGLGNVDNTSDLDKPISTATQNALDGKVDKTTSKNKVYATDSSGGQTTISYSTTATNSTIVQRTSGKQVRVATTPVEDNDATSKKYVDDGLALKANSADLATVATTGEYSDLLNTPTIGNATLSIQKNGTTIDTFTANATSNKTINITVPVTAADVNALPDTTKYTASASMSIDSSTYVVTLQLKDQDGNNIGTAQTIDLPLETMVVSGAYDDATKKIILTLQNGQTIEFSVADLVSGLQTEITSNNMLDADLVDDSTSTNKFVTASDITNWNGKADGTNRLNGAPLSNATTVYYGTSNSAATDVQKEVSIPSITSLDTGTFIIVQPTVTSTVANSTLKLNSFNAYPMFYNGVAVTTSTDSVVWNLAYPSFWVFDGTHWVFAGHGLDSNTTYTLNYSIDAGQYTAGVGTYAITKYSILAQKADGTWEKITATNAAHSAGTAKSVNTNGFRLNQLRYYGTTTVIAGGAKIASNVVYEKAASVDMRYSTNCGATTTWNLGDYIYLVGTIGADGLFYLDTTTWWTNALPTTNDGKLYIRLGLVLAAAGYTMSFFSNRPVFYHDGTGIKEYLVADNKQDKLTAGSNITISGSTISATDTTYTGSDGITLTGTNFTNSGVRSVTSGTANGTISVNTNGTSADVAVTGLGSAAYTSSTDYATSAQGALADTAVQPGDLATVATSGDYDDLLNKPTIPAAQVNSDWDAVSGVAQILNKPSLATVATSGSYSDLSGTPNLATVATSGSYNDLSNKPTIPTVNNPTITITQGGVTKGSFTLNQASGDTIALDAGGGSSLPSQTGHAGEFLTTDGTDASWSDAIGYHPDLFDVKWADHKLDDMQWLRADTFSWQDGTVYEAAFRHLWNDITQYKQWENGGSYIYTQKRFPDVGDKAYSDNTLTTEVGTVTNVDIPDYMTLGTITVNDVVYTATFNSLNIPSTTETVAGTTITFRLTPDGHKICNPSEESNVTAIYNATGVAWYYIFDVEYYRFKLPRTKFGFTGMRDGVGDYVSPGLPNITGRYDVVYQRQNEYGSSGALYGSSDVQTGYNGGNNKRNVPMYIMFDASRSNSIYGNSDTVQPASTQMYLYFYIGNFTQSAIENTAGLNAELFNDKADLDFGNTTMIDYVVEKQDPTSENNYTWYRKYADGWVEQGGFLNDNGTDGVISFNLPIEMANTLYYRNFCPIMATNTGTASNKGAARAAGCYDHDTTTTIYFQKQDSQRYGFWEVKGMAAN